MKFIILGKKQLLAMAGCVLAIGILLAVVTSGAGSSLATAATNRKLPIYATQKKEKVASLSFDAAWGNEDTLKLIEILGKYNVKATFFVVGEWVDKYPESVKALFDAGHEIMNHSDTHPHMPALSREQITEQINKCNTKIAAITGVRPILFRPPYGEYNDALIDVLAGMNSYCIQWDVDSLDWKDLSAVEIQQRVISQTKEGSIILFHNAAKNTPEALPGIIEKLQGDGYTLIPISQLILKENYTIDHEGRQQPIKSSDESQSSDTEKETNALIGPEAVDALYPAWEDRTE